MPIYEFSCHACSHQFEQIIAFSATITPVCPACQSGEVGRHMSRPAIHFKGSGWYITDSRKGNGKNSDTGNGSVGTKAEDNATGEKSSESSDSASRSATSDRSSAGESTAKEPTQATPPTESRAGSALKTAGD